jgi:hypothetical protein
MFSSKKACRSHARDVKRPIRWEVIYAQDESRVMKKSKARGGSSNQSLLERKTIPAACPTGESKGRRESYAIVRWRTGVFWKCVTKKTVGEGESAVTQSSVGNNRRGKGEPRNWIDMEGCVRRSQRGGGWFVVGWGLVCRLSVSVGKVEIAGIDPF